MFPFFFPLALLGGAYYVSRQESTYGALPRSFPQVGPGGPPLNRDQMVTGYGASGYGAHGYGASGYGGHGYGALSRADMASGAPVEGFGFDDDDDDDEDFDEFGHDDLDDEFGLTRSDLFFDGEDQVSLFNTNFDNL